VDSQTIQADGRWQLGERAAASAQVSFSVAMRQQNLPKLKELLHEISSPSSLMWRQFLRREEVEDLVRTSEHDLQAVRCWLETAGIAQTECTVQGGDLLRCSARVEQLESLFETSFFSLKKIGSSVMSITHLGRLTVPREVSEQVDLIQGLSYISFQKAIHHDGSDPFGEERGNAFEQFLQRGFQTVQKRSVPADTVKSYPAVAFDTVASSCPSSSPRGCSTSNGVSTEFCCPEQSTCCPSLGGGKCCAGGLKCCGGECQAAAQCPAVEDIFVQPETLRDHYSVPPSLRATHANFNQSVVAFDDEFSQGALDLFIASVNEAQVPVYRQGPTSCMPNCDQVESDLDMQYMSALGAGVPIWFYYNAEGYTLEWAQDVLNTANAPLVYSISYISGEYQLGADYILRSNAEFIKMGTLGITIMACSGDTGAPGWSINFPVDTRANNFPFDCPQCPTDVNYCSQITVSTSSHKCNVPSGMYSRDVERGIPCDIIMKNSDCASALDQFTSNNAGCQFQIVNDSQKVPRVFSLNCTCSQLKSVTVNGCTVSGYQFDISNGSPLTSLYPASSPFVTAVGATQFSPLTNYLCGSKMGGKVLQCDIGEVVSSIATASRITSGGGFSTLSPAEPYQAQAVAHYLDSGVPLPTGFYNSTMRAYPDVSFGGHNWLISYSRDSGETCPCAWGAVDGTSCASPGFSGLVSLLNSQLVASNQPVLGFLNPLLYSMATSAPQTFQDITMGDNYCTEYVCSDQIGYRSAIGWDAVSGLGSPHFTNILNYLLR